MLPYNHEILAHISIKMNKLKMKQGNSKKVPNPRFPNSAFLKPMMIVLFLNNNIIKLTLK